MKKVWLGWMLAVLPMQLFAGADDDKYFNRDNPTLTSQEREALAIAKRWQDGGDPGKPIPGENGEITYVFGVQQPTIVCAVLQVCAVAMQAGEQVNSLQLGDSARWSVNPVVSGVGANEVLHLIVKPKDVGLRTSLIVATNRRIYHMQLLSHRTSYMPLVSFSYPDVLQDKLARIQARETEERQENTLPTGEYLDNLSFKYEVRGTAPFKPIRVFNDGKKTIIQMPHTLAQGEAPTLLVVRKDGRPLTPDENVIVNYRLQNDRYIVNMVFDKAILIAGVGARQDRVTITRKTD